MLAVTFLRRKFMKVAVTIKIIEKYGRCPVCGSDKIGNGSILNIEDISFKRTCRECGWIVEGAADGDGNIHEIFNNCCDLKNGGNKDEK